MMVSDRLIALSKVLKILGYCLFASTPGMSSIRTWGNGSIFASQKDECMVKNRYLCATCPDGGIGRRAGLKHLWSNPCRFDPGSGHFETH